LKLFVEAILPSGGCLKLPVGAILPSVRAVLTLSDTFENRLDSLEPLSDFRLHRASIPAVHRPGESSECPFGAAADDAAPFWEIAAGYRPSSTDRARATMNATESFIPTGSSVTSGCVRANTRKTSSQKPCPTTSTQEKSRTA
jgi:hypothetical protein